MTVELPSSRAEVNISFDPAEFRARYETERKKRLRPQNVAQFTALRELEMSGGDPYAEPFTRESIIKDLDVAVLGGGFAGLLAGSYLTKLGINDFHIVEQAGDFGGTWYWNRYPGVQCDVESYVYLPLLDETGYMPTRRYADGDEVFEYARLIGRHFDLYSKALFQTTITSTDWDDHIGRWIVKTNRGDILRARFVLRGNGPLSKPQVPKVAGLQDFQGKIIHTSRWDYEYTGGSSRGGLGKLHDKKVAVVGTGASAVQVVPYLAKDAAELYVVQRTPTVVGPRENRDTDGAWRTNLQSGWQERRIHNHVSLINGHAVEERLTDDICTFLIPALSGQHLVDVPRESLPAEDLQALGEIADMQMMHEFHERIDSVINDSQTAEQLKPWFGFMCKRPCFNDEYLTSFNQDNVHLLHAPSGIDYIDESGIVVGGVHYDVDCIVFATGFETGSSSAEQYGYDTVGRGGLSLHKHFSDGTKSLHGFCTHGFPNMFDLGLSQNAYGFNFTYMLERKARHAVRIVAHALVNGINTIEPDIEAQSQWVDATASTKTDRLAYLANCTPGYFNGQGNLNRGFFSDVYEGSEIEFWEMLDTWYESGDFDGLVLTPLQQSHADISASTRAGL